MHKNFNGIFKWQYKMQTDFPASIHYTEHISNFTPLSLRTLIWCIICLLWRVSRMRTPNFYANAETTNGVYDNSEWDSTCTLQSQLVSPFVVIKISLQFGNTFDTHTRGRPHSQTLICIHETINANDNLYRIVRIFANVNFFCKNSKGNA